MIKSEAAYHLIGLALEDLQKRGKNPEQVSWYNIFFVSELVRWLNALTYKRTFDNSAGDTIYLSEAIAFINANYKSAKFSLAGDMKIAVYRLSDDFVIRFNIDGDDNYLGGGGLYGGQINGRTRKDSDYFSIYIPYEKSSGDIRLNSIVEGILNRNKYGVKFRFKSYSGYTEISWGYTPRELGRSGSVPAIRAFTSYEAPRVGLDVKDTFPITYDTGHTVAIRLGWSINKSAKEFIDNARLGDVDWDEWLEQLAKPSQRELNYNDVKIDAESILDALLVAKQMVNIDLKTGLLLLKDYINNVSELGRTIQDAIVDAKLKGMTVTIDGTKDDTILISIRGDVAKYPGRAPKERYFKAEIEIEPYSGRVLDASANSTDPDVQLALKTLKGKKLPLWDRRSIRVLSDLIPDMILVATGRWEG